VLLGKKKLNFSYWFKKKKTSSLNSGNNHEKQHFAASPIQRLGSKNQ
jgi:hypothetical protein